MTLAKASPDQLVKLLTALILQNKFCEGTLAEAYGSGLLLAILHRARDFGKSQADIQNWKNKETQARRAIEDRGFKVHDANIVFRENCPNIDLIVFSKAGASYVQVKSSENPASKNGVVIDGSPWTEDQLYKDAPIFNKHNYYQASLIVIVDRIRTGETNFYLAPPAKLEELVRERAKKWADTPKKDGTQRSIKFRKELPREVLAEWHSAWHLLGEI